MSARNLTAYSVKPYSGEKKVMAKFALRGTKVHAKFESRSFQKEIESGILVGGKTYRLEDGPKFMEALEKAYSRSSTTIIEAS